MSKNEELLVPTTKNEAVKVAIRCRPLSSKEINEGNQVIVDIPEGRTDIFVQRPGAQEEPK